MSKSLSITVYPSSLDGEYLTVSDAMRQVLDIVETLERIEGADAGAKRIVWRLTEAHTNSPPFTVTVAAFSSDPVISVEMEAGRVASIFSENVGELLQGDIPSGFDSDLGAPLRRAFKRNLNGVGRTDIKIDAGETLQVVPSTAQAAVAALDQIEVVEQGAAIALRRTEYGTVEAEVVGLTRWNGKPALVVQHRLSGMKVTCVLAKELAGQVGPAHRWIEAWEAGSRVLISGALHYGDDGNLRRIDAETVVSVPYTDVSLSELRGIDILEGRTVAEHLRLVRGG